MSNTIKFTIELPEHESDSCPSCRATDVFDCESERPDLYCRGDWHIAEKEVELPAHWVICDNCSGNGKHVNRNIDGNGITSSEMEELGDEFMEDYMSGVYDVSCDECCGSGKCLVVDEEAAERKDPAILKLWQKRERQRARWDAEDRHTRFMESGGRWD